MSISSILYEVNATIHDPSVCDPWVRWILDQHISDVVQAGAQRGRLIAVDSDASHFSVQYEFADRAALQKYLETEAPRLRDEGASLFSGEQVSYARRTGQIQLPTKP